MAENLTIDFLHNYIKKEVRTSDPIAYQYDLGRILVMMIPDTVSSVEVHYWKNGMSQSEAYNANVEAADKGSVVTAHVPNKYFETSGDLRVYVVIAESGQDATMYEGLIPIKERPMPDGYVDDDPDNEATRVLVEARAAAATATAAAEECVRVEQSIPADYTQLSEDVSSLKGGLPEDIKQALLQIASKIIYLDGHGPKYYADLEDALYAVKRIILNASSIAFDAIGSTFQLTAVTDPAGETVTWSSSDDTIASVSDTGLVTAVAYGSATIVARSRRTTATCSVLSAEGRVESIRASYTQGTVYTTDALDSLKNSLVVTATWSSGNVETLENEDYTLTGTLSEGTNTITVAYAGLTTTFAVEAQQAYVSSTGKTYTKKFTYSGENAEKPYYLSNFGTAYGKMDELEELTFGGILGLYASGDPGKLTWSNYPKLKKMAMAPDSLQNGKTILKTPHYFFSSCPETLEHVQFGKTNNTYYFGGGTYFRSDGKSAGLSNDNAIGNTNGLDLVVYTNSYDAKGKFLGVVESTTNITCYLYTDGSILTGA